MLVLATLGLALAVAPGPTIEWSAPPGCPGQAQVLAQTRALLGDANVEAALRSVTIRGGIEVASAGFVLHVDVVTPSGVTRKSAQTDDCAVLASVAALMVAVAVDPVQATHTLGIGPAGMAKAASPAGEPGPEPPPEPEPPGPEPELVIAAVEPTRGAAAGSTAPAEPTAARAPERPGARTVGGLVRASASLGRGMVPARDGSVAVGVGLLARSLRAELVGLHVLAQDARYSEPSPAGATVAAWGGSLRIGPRFAAGPVELHALAGLGVAALTATGFGVVNRRTAFDAHVAIALIPGLRWAPSRWVALGADLEGEVALRRPAFTVGTLPEVYRADRLGVRGSVVIELRWGRGPG